MAVVAQCNDGAEECQPHQKPARQLLRDRDAGVEAIAQDNVAKNEHNHHREACGYAELEKTAVKVDDFGHVVFPNRQKRGLGRGFDATQPGATLKLLNTLKF